MASSQRATSMITHPLEDSAEGDHHGPSTRRKDLTSVSHHRKSIESSHKHKNKHGHKSQHHEREASGRKGHSEKKRKRGSRSGVSRQEHHPDSREYRDYYPEYEPSRASAYPDRDQYRDHYREHRRSERDERDYRRYEEEERRPHRPTESESRHPRPVYDDYYDNSREIDSQRQKNHREFRDREDRDQGEQYRRYDRSHQEAGSPPVRPSDPQDTSESFHKQSKHRSPSPEAFELSPSGERVPKSAKRSDKQKERTLRHLQARKATKDFFQRLSISPDRERTDRSDDKDVQPNNLDRDFRHSNPRSRNPAVSSNASIHEGEAHDMNPSNHMSRHGPGPADSRQHYPPQSSQYATPSHSHHGSPQPASPYGRGGWGGAHYPQHQYPANGYSPHRQNSYPGTQHVDTRYYQNQQYHGHNGQQGHYSPSYHNGPPYSNTDRRYSGGQTSPLNPSNPQQSQTQTEPAPEQSSTKPTSNDDDNPFRPPKNLRAEDEGPISNTTKEASADQSKTSNGSGTSKVSFAFKAKPSAPAPKTAPDLTQKMKEPRKENVMDSNKSKAPANAPTAPSASSAPREAPTAPRDSTREGIRGPRERGHPKEPPREPYRDPYGRPRDERYYEQYERERHERAYDERYRDDRYYDRSYHGDPREHFEGPRDYRRDPRDYQDPRIDDPRYLEHDRRHTEKSRRRKHDHERKSGSKPELIIVKKKMTRILPRPTLSEEHAQSNSVYYRKPGNESVIGAGTYGKVFKAVHVYTKEEVALKKIRMEGERDGFPVTAVREVKLLQSLHHPNIVRLLEVMVENNDCYMVFEYASHDLTGLLNHPNFTLTAAHKKHLIKQLFDGLDYLHRRGVLHRDIKAANILVTNKGELKLADFGLARFYKKHKVQDYTNRVITIWYRPPELLLGETQYGAAVDVWSAACVMMEVFTKHAIFPGDGHEINQLEKIYNMLGTPTLEEWPGMKELAWFDFLRPVTKKPSVFAEKYRERLTPQAFDLMKALFVYDPKKRPTAEYVLMHPYFTKEEPEAAQALELAELKGDWHEFESKALRRKKEQRDRDARMNQAREEQQKRKAVALEEPVETGPDPKKTKPSANAKEDVVTDAAAADE